MTTLSLEPALAATLDRLTASGRYASPSEALKDAVGLLDHRETTLAELDLALTRAIASVDAGHVLSIDDAERSLTARYAVG